MMKDFLDIYPGLVEVYEKECRADSDRNGHAEQEWLGHHQNRLAKQDGKEAPRTDDLEYQRLSLPFQRGLRTGVDDRVLHAEKTADRPHISKLGADERKNGIREWPGDVWSAPHQ